MVPICVIWGCGEWYTPVIAAARLLLRVCCVHLAGGSWLWQLGSHRLVLQRLVT